MNLINVLVKVYVCIQIKLFRFINQGLIVREIKCVGLWAKLKFLASERVMLIGVLKLNWLTLNLYIIRVPIKLINLESYRMEQRSRLHPA